MSEPAVPAGSGVPAESGQLAAALAARAKLQRLLDHPTPFSGDDGSSDPRVDAACAEYCRTRAATMPDPQARMGKSEVPAHPHVEAAHEARVRLVEALVGSRLIVPVLAHAREERGAEKDPCARAVQLAIDIDPTHRALPVFTSVEKMRQWRSDVRPVPARVRDAARVAHRETNALMVLNPGTDSIPVPRPAVAALAEERPWVPSYRDSELHSQLRAALEMIDDVAGVACEVGQTAELRVFLLVDAHGDMSRLARAVHEAQLVMVNPQWGERIDTVELVPLSPEGL